MKKPTKKEEKKAFEIVLGILHFSIINTEDNSDEKMILVYIARNLYFFYNGWSEGCNLKPRLMKSLQEEIHKTKVSHTKIPYN